MTLKHVLSDRINRNYFYAFFKDFSFFTAVLVPFFTDWGHISQFQIQIIQSWFSLWVFVLEIPTGAIADKIGRKHSIELGSLIVGLAVILYGSIPSFAIFLVAEFFFAVGYALNSGADQALLYDTLKELGRENESKKILGRAESFHQLGMAVAASLGGLIAAKFGLNAPILASSGAFFLAAAIGWSIPEPTIHQSGSQSPNYLTIMKNGLRTIRHNSVVQTLALDSVLVSGAVYFILWFYQPLLKQVGVPITYFGFIFTFMLLVQIFISSNYTLVEKVLGSGKSYIRNSAVLTALAFVVVALFPSIWTILLFIVFAGGVGYTRATCISSIAHKYIGSGERSTVLSSINMLRRFALIVLNPIVGYIATKSLTTALFIVGLLPLLSLFIKEEIE